MGLFSNLFKKTGNGEKEPKQTTGLVDISNSVSAPQYNPEILPLQGIMQKLYFFGHFPSHSQ